MAEITRRQTRKQRWLTKGKVTAAVLVLAVLGLVGWLIYSANSITPIKDANAKPTIPLPDTSITPGPGPDFTTYTNNILGFSVSYPTNMLSPYGSPCTTSDVQPDGTQDAAANGYRPAAGPQQVKIISDGKGMFYIIEVSTFQPSGVTTDASGHTFYSSCPVVKPTIGQAGSAAQSRSLYTFSVAALSVSEANSEADIVKTANVIFRTSEAKVTALAPDVSGKWQDVSLDCGDAPCQTPNSTIYLRYYTAQRKFVYIAMPQKLTFEATDGKSFYDQQILGGFKLTK